MKKSIKLTIENEEKIFFDTVMSKKGLPCLWELGAFYGKIGHSLIITDDKFKKTGAIFVKNDLHAQEEHALVPVAEGFYVFKSIFHKPDYTTYLYRITEVSGILIVASLVGYSILTTNDTDFLNKNYKNKNFISAFDISLDKAEGEKTLYCYPPTSKKIRDKKVHYVCSPKKVIHHKEKVRRNDISKIEIIGDVIIGQLGGFEYD